MSDKRKTAVEYLKNNLPSLFQDNQSGFYTTLFEQAKALEREQIEDAYGDGLNAHRTNFCNRNEYYEQTYGE
jgi:hypothetical protein